MKKALATAIMTLVTVAAIIPLLTSGGLPPPGVLCPTPVDEMSPILTTIRIVETGEDYQRAPDPTGRSGGYNLTPTQWDNYSGFADAYQASEAAQDARAAQIVNELLAQADNNVALIPVLWLLGAVPNKNDPAWNETIQPAGVSPAQYQRAWMTLYRKLAPTEPPPPGGQNPDPTWDSDGLPPNAPRPQVTGAALWVAPDGNDTNPGQQQSPLRTIQAAVNRAQPGTTINVETGTYRPIVIAKSGRHDAWILITAAPGATPRITSPQGEGVRIRGAYIAINGFIIEGTNGADQPGGLGYGYGVLVTNYTTGNLLDVHHVSVTNNEVFGWSTGGVVAGWSNWLVFAGNYTHHNAYYGREGGSGISILESTGAGGPPDPSGYTQWIIGNTSNDNRQLVPSSAIGYPNERLDGNGIILDRLDVGARQHGFIGKTLISHNYIANNGGRGSHAFESSNVLMEHNTLWHNGEYQNGELSAYASNNVTFTKNVVAARPGRTVYFGQGINAGDNHVMDPNTTQQQILAYAQQTGLGAQNIDIRRGGLGLTPTPGGCIPGNSLIPVTQGWSIPASRTDLPGRETDDPHHDYPAWDWTTPQDTAIYAIRGGEIIGITTYNQNWFQAGCTYGSGCGRCGVGITIQDSDGTKWTYCHATNTTVAVGQTVQAGQQIMWSGNTGRSTGPHLHLGIRTPDGQSRCPQPLLVALYYYNQSIEPQDLPASGCITGANTLSKTLATLIANAPPQPDPPTNGIPVGPNPEPAPQAAPTHQPPLPAVRS